MKKILIAFALVASVGLLAGCQSNKTEGFDNADTASFDEAADTDAASTDIGNPPIPPDPEEAE